MGLYGVYRNKKGFANGFIGLAFPDQYQDAILHFGELDIVFLFDVFFDNGHGVILRRKPVHSHFDGCE